MRTLTEHMVAGDAVNHQIGIDVEDEPSDVGGNHRYLIKGPKHGLMRLIFQNGPIGEVGVNGITNEALVAIVVDRLRGFQKGKFACQENASALTHLEIALGCLQRRTRARIARGVEGTREI